MIITQNFFTNSLEFSSGGNEPLERVTCVFWSFEHDQTRCLDKKACCLFYFFPKVWANWGVGGGGARINEVGT